MLKLSITKLRMKNNAHLKLRLRTKRLTVKYRPVVRGNARCRSQKGPPDRIVKDLKWYKINVVNIGRVGNFNAFPAV